MPKERAALCSQHSETRRLMGGVSLLHKMHTCVLYARSADAGGFASPMVHGSDWKHLLAWEGDTTWGECVISLVGDLDVVDLAYVWGYVHACIT